MKKNYIVLSVVMYVIAILILLFYSIMSFKIQLAEISRLILLCGSCLFLYFGGFFLSKYLNNNKPMKINLWICFILYLVLILTFTLFDPMLGRNFSIVHWSKNLFNEYIHNSFNIIPFHTIIDYVSKFNSLYDTRTIMVNLFGNIILLMPMSIFLTLLFKKEKNLKKFLLTVIVIALGIEVIQFLTLSGSCDIDDIILNVVGSILAYIIFRINSINSIIRNILLLEKNNVAKSKILKIIILTVFFVVLFIVIIWYRNYLYNKNLNTFIQNYNYSLKIIDRDKGCDNELEKFYEDEYYIYYFKCNKSDKVYALINDKEKYLVKDLLNNNPTQYFIDIEKLKEAGLEFIQKNKYTDINIKGTGNVYSKVDIIDKKIIKISQGNMHQDVNSNSNKTNFQECFFIIPLSEGETIITISYYDTENDALQFKKRFNISVDNKLIVTYKDISVKE